MVDPRSHDPMIIIYLMIISFNTPILKLTERRPLEMIELCFIRNHKEKHSIPLGNATASFIKNWLQFQYINFSALFSIRHTVVYGKKKKKRNDMKYDVLKHLLETISQVRLNIMSKSKDRNRIMQWDSE